MSVYTIKKTDRNYPKLRADAPAVAALLDLAYERPGFNPQDYGDYRTYKNEQAAACRALADCERAVYQAISLGVLPDVQAQLIERAVGTRLEYDNVLNLWHYTEGQFYSVEYRAAIRAALRNAVEAATASNVTDASD